MIESTNNKLAKIEKSQTFLSDRYDKMSKSLDVNNTDISKVQNEVKSLAQKNTDLKKANQILAEDVIDLECRSMRDNLVIVGISEIARPLQGFLGAGGGADQREQKKPFRQAVIKHTLRNREAMLRRRQGRTVMLKSGNSVRRY